jgi:hypothetical protein
MDVGDGGRLAQETAAQETAAQETAARPSTGGWQMGSAPS